MHKFLKLLKRLGAKKIQQCTINCYNRKNVGISWETACDSLFVRSRVQKPYRTHSGHVHTLYYTWLSTQLVPVKHRSQLRILFGASMPMPIPYNRAVRGIQSTYKYSDTRDFRLPRDADEICPLLRYYADWSSNSVATFRGNLLVTSSSVKIQEPVETWRWDR
jgi:hypothetical protein